MDTDRRDIHVGTDEARAGSTPHVVRYVLIIGLVLVILAFTAIVMTGSMNANHANNGVDDSARAAAEQKVREQQ